MSGSHCTHPPIKKMNERFPPKGTPIKSFFFWFSLLPDLIVRFLFSGFSFGKMNCEAKPSNQQQNREREKRT